MMAPPPARRRPHSHHYLDRVLRALDRERRDEARRPPALDALELLRRQHRELAAMFARFRRGRDERAEAICLALDAHATIEEEIFYPAVRAALPDVAALIAAAAIEHDAMRALVARIESARVDDAACAAQVRVLGEYLRLHVRVEQSAVFPQVRRSGLDRRALGARMAARHAELVRRPAARAG
jgi:hypothetical protein